MNNGKYLNEEQYQNTKKKVNNTGKILLIVGIILLIVGIVMVIFGVINFGKAADEAAQSFEDSYYNLTMPSSKDSTSLPILSLILIFIGGLISMIGLFMGLAGIIAIAVAHRREITAFSVQGTMPVAQEGIDTISPNLGNAAESISRGIVRGRESAKQENENKE